MNSLTCARLLALHLKQVGVFRTSTYFWVELSSLWDVVIFGQVNQWQNRRIGGCRYLSLAKFHRISSEQIVGFHNIGYRKGSGGIYSCITSQAQVNEASERIIGASIMRSRPNPRTCVQPYPDPDWNHRNTGKNSRFNLLLASSFLESRDHWYNYWAMQVIAWAGLRHHDTEIRRVQVSSRIYWTLVYKKHWTSLALSFISFMHCMYFS